MEEQIMKEGLNAPLGVAKGKELVQKEKRRVAPAS